MADPTMEGQTTDVQERYRAILDQSWRTIDYTVLGEKHSQKIFDPPQYYVSTSEGRTILRGFMQSEADGYIILRCLGKLQETGDPEALALRTQFVHDTILDPHIDQKLLKSVCMGVIEDVDEEMFSTLVLLLDNPDPELRWYPIRAASNIFKEPVKNLPPVYQKIIAIVTDGAEPANNRTWGVIALGSLDNNRTVDQTTKAQIRAAVGDLIARENEDRDVLAQATWFFSEDETIPLSPQTDFIRIGDYDLRAARFRIAYLDQSGNEVPVLHCFAVPRNFTTIFIDTYKDRQPGIIESDSISGRLIYAGDYTVADRLVCTGQGFGDYELLPYQSELHRVQHSFKWKNANGDPFGEEEWRKVPWSDPKYQIIIAEKPVARFKIIPNQ